MKARFLFVDNSGNSFAPSLDVYSVLGAGLILHEMVQHSAALATLTRITQQFGGDIPGSVPASSYNTVNDVADLVYLNGSNQPVHLLIPAPGDSIFLGDMETVDPAAVAALTAQVLIYGRSPSGSGLSSFRSGTRRRIEGRR